MAKESLDAGLAEELLEVKLELEKVEREWYNSGPEIIKLQARITDLQGKGDKLRELRAKYKKMLDENELSETLKNLFTVRILSDIVPHPEEEKTVNKPTKAQVEEFYKTTLADGQEMTVEELKEAYKEAGWDGGIRPDLNKGLKKSGDKFRLK